MRGSEVNINLSEMKEWTSALKSSDTMKIIALENGDIAMGAELRKSMSEKMADAWKIKLYATDDMKILAVHPDINSDFRYPKNGRRKFKSYVESLKNKGYKIPATYNVEWNEKIQSWVGILQEVAESPRLTNGRRKMRNKISRYEENQVDRFLYDLYLLWGGNLDEDMCIGEGWIVYLEGREKYQYDIGDAEYWEYVRTNVKKLFLDLRKIRNNRIRIESRLSLNQRFGEEKEEIGAIFPGKTGDFANYVALWDYAERLGSIKYEILNLMNAREEDYDIMRILHLDKEDYYGLKKELREDFLYYLECA